MTAGPDFELPPELEAGQPPEARGLARDGVRLLVADGSGMQHARFTDLGGFLRAGDVLVVNTSATLAAAGSRFWRARVAVEGDVRAYLSVHGRPISYAYLAGSWPLTAYQTVFARDPGSAEMPSAGRPFST